jgi:hypothetical protein
MAKGVRGVHGPAVALFDTMRENAVNTDELHPSVREEISDYMQLDIDALYGLIPPFLPEYSGTLFSNEGQEGAGKKAFEARLPRFKEKLCTEWKLCEKMKDPNFEDGVKLAVIIGDVIAATTGGIPPFLAASLLIKIGLRRVCECKPSTT